MIPQDFYKEEIRNDFKVTEKRKRIWAVEIDLLEEFDKCCKKYNLKYFVTDGTFLGAIRHKGFIPWDDDIDVAMFREDYDKLLKIAPNFFKDKYQFQSYKTEKSYYKLHAQLRNSNTTAILSNEIDKNIEYNQGVFIDIFPMDAIPKQERKKEKFFNRIDKILNTIYGYINYKTYKNHSLLGRIKKMIMTVIGMKTILEYYERRVKKYSIDNDSRIGYISYFGSKTPLWEYKKIKEMSQYTFEFISVTAPKEYDYFLTVEYGDYMELVKGKSDHGEVFFDPEKPYTYYFNEGRKELEEYATAEH